MSFKRDGDDKSLLGNLRKRRINELLGEDVPKDEALLLSNGRYTCLVCNHRPIFDTLYMLTIHRKGRKHDLSKEYHRQQQQSLEDLIQKRKHEHYLVDGTTEILQTKYSHQGLGLGAPYDPRVKKPKLHNPKIRLDLKEKTNGHGTPSERCNKNITSSEAPGKSSQPLTQPPSSHLDNYISRTDANYSDKSNAHTNGNEQPMISSTKHTCTDMNRDSRINDKKDKEKKVGKISTALQEKKLKAEKYLHFRGAGWKKDLSGNWIKDEGAEFDSDEEPPDLP